MKPALRWRAPFLVFRRTGRGASWCGSTLLCTLEIKMQKLEQGALFGSPNSRRFAKACAERVNSIGAEQ